MKEQLSAVTDNYTQQIRQQQLTIRQQEMQIDDLRKRIAQLENVLSKVKAIVNQEH